MEENKDSLKERLVKTIDPQSLGTKFKKYISVGWEFFKIAIIAAIIVLPIRYFIFQPFIVKGESMLPNFHSGDYLIVDQISYKIKDPKRGDVIVFKYPLDVSQRYIKRIIGLPYEKVEIINGEIIISKVTSEGLEGNSEKLILSEEEYLPNFKDTEGGLSVTLSENEFFVLGDNRQFSYDSRKWGILPQKNIIGKAIFRVFPVQNMLYIRETNY